MTDEVTVVDSGVKVNKAMRSMVNILYGCNGGYISYNDGTFLFDGLLGSVRYNVLCVIFKNVK